MRPCDVSGCSVFFVPLRFLTRFSGFCLYNADVSGHLRIPNSTPIPYHSLISIRVRVVLERERGRGEECKDSGSGLWIERLNREFWMSNSFPSLLFSHLTFMLCNF